MYELQISTPKIYSHSAMNKRTVFLCSMKKTTAAGDLDNSTSTYIDVLRSRHKMPSKEEFRSDYARFVQNPLLPGLDSFLVQTLVALKYRADYLESDSVRLVELLLQTSGQLAEDVVLLVVQVFYMMA